MSALDRAHGPEGIQCLCLTPTSRLQQSTQGPLTPGYRLGIGRKFTLALAKCGRMNLIAAIDTHRGNDMVQELVVDDEFDKISWHKRLIEGRMKANRLRVRQVGAKAHGAWPGSPAPASPANPDLRTIREIARP